jgi:hypothetical protein
VPGRPGEYFAWGDISFNYTSTDTSDYAVTPSGSHQGGAGVVPAAVRGVRLRGYGGLYPGKPGFHGLKYPLLLI